MKSNNIFINVMIILLAVAAVAGTFYLADNNPAKEEGVINDATDVLASGAATEAGREARDPIINTEQGNMLVFFFTLGGLVAGGLVGFNWRRLMTGNENPKSSATGRVGILAGFILVGAWIILAAFEAFSGNPIFNPELGDVVLFIFISSGSVIGIIAGYQYQKYAVVKNGRAGTQLIG
ncbi:MAG: hypothetical protein P3T54_06340 [Dehalogenimonas sp.]|uniref:Uncharacterized protein n=1 Tax=Candidatus Dehalogenimonas loeffleri TaxID=3127115 RepID=A0ABZ2J9H4_9CHLR|nr:hypothetical protein [Dehalogenimonas sp.]